MHPDLQHLIALQKLDSRADAVRRDIVGIPARQEAAALRLAEAREVVDRARAALALSQERRKSLDKDLAVVEGRLSKYKDQLMAVKTNDEFHAMQKQIAAAKDEVRAVEERILEQMLESDTLTAALNAAEGALQDAQRTITEEQAALARDREAGEAELARLGAERGELTARISPPALARFEQAYRARKGIAMAEARDGLCTICHLRLRPQVFNEVRRNASLITCESCQRILYFQPVAAANAQA